MDIRGLKLSVVFIILIFTFSYCGGGTGGDTQEASINLFIELPEEFFSDSTTELSSERVIRLLQPNFDGAVIMLEVTGEGISPPIMENIPVSEDGPTQVTIFVPAGTDRLFDAKFIDGDGILMAFCSTMADIVFGGTNNVVLPCSPFVCTECDDDPEVETVCKGERCDLNDDTKVCVDGQCITPTPPPTPSPTPTPAPTPTPTPRPILGCCDLGQTCARTSNLQCADMKGFFFPGAMCFANGCSTTPPTPTPGPPGCCQEDEGVCSNTTEDDCPSGAFFCPEGSCISIDGPEFCSCPD